MSEELRENPVSRIDSDPKGDTMKMAKFEARICKDMPADCCDYGVVSFETGKEVCRVWLEEDARKIADLLNGAAPASAEPGERISRDRDIILEAINEYDAWMLDDDYNAGPVLDRIIKRMKERAL